MLRIAAAQLDAIHGIWTEHCRSAKHDYKTRVQQAKKRMKTEDKREKPRIVQLLTREQEPPRGTGSRDTIQEGKQDVEASVRRTNAHKRQPSIARAADHDLIGNPLNFGKYIDNEHETEQPAEDDSSDDDWESPRRKRKPRRRRITQESKATRQPAKGKKSNANTANKRDASKTTTITNDSSNDSQPEEPRQKKARSIQGTRTQQSEQQSSRQDDTPNSEESNTSNQTQQRDNNSRTSAKSGEPETAIPSEVNPPKERGRKRARISHERHQTQRNTPRSRNHTSTTSASASGEGNRDNHGTGKTRKRTQPSAKQSTETAPPRKKARTTRISETEFLQREQQAI